MADLVFIALILGFFGLATLLVAACDRIIGPDPDPDAESSSTRDRVVDVGPAEPELTGSAS